MSNKITEKDIEKFREILMGLADNNKKIIEAIFQLIGIQAKRIELLEQCVNRIEKIDLDTPLGKMKQEFQNIEKNTFTQTDVIKSLSDLRNAMAIQNNFADVITKGVKVALQMSKVALAFGII